MRGLLIDPTARTIMEVTIPAGDIHAIYAACGWGCFDVVRLTRHEAMYVDDEGLLVYPNPQGYFAIGDRTFAGRALVLGSTPDGDSCDTALTVDQLALAVSWLPTPNADDVEPRIEVIPWDDTDN